MDSKVSNYRMGCSVFPKPPLIATPEILKEVFIYNKYSQFIPIIKSHTSIEELYEKLKNPQNDKELIFLLKTLQEIILNNPDIVSLLSPINSNNQFFTTLIEVFLSHCDGSKFNQKVLNITIDICKFLTHILIITETQYQKVYNFMTENKNLTIETSDHLLSLLECLYINSICIIKQIHNQELPKNHINHNGEGYLEMLNIKPIFELNGKYLHFIINFYIRAIGEDMSNYFQQQKKNKLEYPSSIFEISLDDRSVFKICLEESYERMFCIYDASKNKSKQNELFSLNEEVYWYTNLEENSWYSLNLVLNYIQKDKISKAICKIQTIPNNAESDVSIYKSNIHTLEINKITSVKFYNNFYGLSTSIIIGDLKGENDEIKMDKIIKFGIYNNKSLDTFNKCNEYIKKNGKIKCFSPHKNQMKDNRIILGDIFNSNLECQIVNKKFPINSENHINKDSEYFIFNIPHLYKNITKNMGKIGSIVQILPLFETLIRKKCLCQDNFKLLFSLIKVTILKNKMNLLEAISHDFFLALSLIFEALDKEHFSREIYEGIVSINVFYLTHINYLFQHETNIEKLISFPKYIFFNHCLIKKFDSLTWNYILDEMVRFLNNLLYKRGPFAELKTFSLYIENIITVEGMIQILRDIDKFYPTKMCCSEHALFYGKQSITFKLEKSFRAIEGIFDIIILLIFSAKKPMFASLLRFIVLSFSPCMKNFIFCRIKKFIENIKTDEFYLSEFQKYCKCENISAMFMFLISTSDIFVQFKLIELYTILFDFDQEAFRNENFFKMVKNSLFLNNIHKENYISKEYNTPPKNEINFERKRSLSSLKRNIDEGMIYLSYEPDIKNEKYYCISQKLETEKFTNCEIINFNELVPSHFRKEYSDKNNGYLLQLFEKFRQLFLSNINNKAVENEMQKKKCLFLFNCLCIFVSRSNNIKILTLFCEAMKELENTKKNIYYIFAYESQDYFSLLLETYFHLRILQKQKFTGISSRYVDNEKGIISENMKKIIKSLNKTLLDSIKVLLRDCNNLQRLYNFCIFNQLLYKNDTHISYIIYIKTFFYDLFTSLLNDVKPDYANMSNKNIFVTLANILFEFCFVFDRNYDLITTKNDAKLSFNYDVSKVFSLPNFFSYWYNGPQHQCIEENLGFVLIASFVETLKYIWNFSENYSMFLTDINNQNEKRKQLYIEELINKYVYPKDRSQCNYYNKLCFLCTTVNNPNSKYICILKIISFYFLGIFFSNQCNNTQTFQEAVKLFIFLFSIIALTANANVEVPKKGSLEEYNINRINSECLEILVVLFVSLLSFYFQTTNEQLKKDFHEWLILTFNFITNLFIHKKSRRNPTNPIYKLFKEVFVNEKKRNIILDPGKFSIKIKRYSDHKALLDNPQFWLPIIQKNKEVQKLSNNFYQQETIIFNCINRFVAAKHFVPLNIQFLKYHSLNLDKIREFNLKVETPYISITNSSQSVSKLVKLHYEFQNDYTVKFLIENSQIRRTFNYYQRILLYQNLKQSFVKNLWNFSSSIFASCEYEQDELYQKFFKKRFNDSEYVQNYCFNCVYNNNIQNETNINKKGFLLMDFQGFMFVGDKTKNSKLKCVYLPFDSVVHISKLINKPNNCIINASFSVQILCNDQIQHSFILDRVDFTELISSIKKNPSLNGKTMFKNAFVIK